MKLGLIVPLLAAVFAVACGGGDDSSGTQSNDGTSTTQPAATARATPPPGGATSPASQGSTSVAADKAVVTIAGERYEVDLLSCIQLGGALGAVGGRGTSISIDLPPPGWESKPEDWDPPNVRVRDTGKDKDWRAGGEELEGIAAVKDGQSQVDSYKIEGKKGSGTATFVDLNAVLKGKVEPVKGTFEVACK